MVTEANLRDYESVDEFKVYLAWAQETESLLSDCNYCISALEEHIDIDYPYLYDSTEITSNRSDIKSNNKYIS